MRIIGVILDFFLPKEIKNLAKITRYLERVNEITFEEKENTEKDIFELMDIELMLKSMETKEHKKKVDMVIYIINQFSLKKPKK